ncbi:hypothetical protein BJ166DRAFT_512328 [Pestalotiopsis sp. NC0098]|nr:hypothetical protein BJ166DRAFT_512328 [Pestalotiopsis sp. NC0098]
MVSRRSLWAAISVLVGRSASSHVQNGVVSSVISRDPTGPPAWVTVNSDGGATTMTPIVATTDGTASTISAAPSELTQTAAWTLTISGATTTSTGINPVATASGPGEEGAFLLCDNYQGEHAPICQPEDGSALDPGAVYYVTWNSMYYDSENTSVQVEGTFADGDGFASEAIPGTRGFYTWNTTNISQKLGSNKSSMEVSLSLITLDVNGTNTASRQEGPTVILGSSTGSGSSGSKIDVLTVALPSMLGVTVLVIVCAVCVLRRKRSSLPSWLSWLFVSPPKPSPEPPRTTKVDAKPPKIDKALPRYDIQLTNRDSWSATSLGREPHPGRNVFREEMARQNKQRVCPFDV